MIFNDVNVNSLLFVQAFSHEVDYYVASVGKCCTTHVYGLNVCCVTSLFCVIWYDDVRNTIWYLPFESNNLYAINNTHINIIKLIVIYM